MITIDFSNAEALIFHDAGLQKLLPDHMFSVFEQWRLAKRVPYLRGIGRQAVLDLLGMLTDEDVGVLSEYFGEKVLVKSINYSLAESYKVPLDEACDLLCDKVFFNYHSVWRDDVHLYLTMWR